MEGGELQVLGFRIWASGFRLKTFKISCCRLRVSVVGSRFKVLGVGVTVRFLGLMHMPYLPAAVQQVTAGCLLHRTLAGGSFRTLVLMLKKKQSLLAGYVSVSACGGRVQT